MPKPKPQPAQPVRPIDKYFNEYTAAHQDGLNRTLGFVFIPLMLFGLIGIAWAAPFPRLEFLRSYESFFNWASFLIAILVYSYYRLSKVMAYIMLLLLFALSYGLIWLDGWQHSGGPAMWMVCGGIFVISVIVLMIGNTREKQKTSFFTDLYIGPVWLLHLLLKRTRLKY